MEIVKIGNKAIKLVEEGKTIVRAYATMDKTWMVGDINGYIETSESAAKELFKTLCKAHVLKACLA